MVQGFKDLKKGGYDQYTGHFIYIQVTKRIKSCIEAGGPQWKRIRDIVKSVKTCFYSSSVIAQIKLLVL